MTPQCGKQIFPSTSRTLQLQFNNKLSLPIFTGCRIEGEDYSVITIALVDALTGQVVVSGPESSMKVEIVVLEGDFEGGEEENWTYEEFRSNIVREREGKRSLLTGDALVELNKGFGVIGELSFTDNSSWTRSRKFRLGAKVVDGYFSGMRVREARTEPFMVKDHRGELYKKHYPPSLSDEVWRLEKIGKDGAFHKRLSSENIHTVKDFLTLLVMDATRLRNILGSGMSTKMWEVTVEHARTCTISDQPHVYYPNGHTKPGVVFNVVGQVMGLISEQQFVALNNLSDNEKAEAQVAVKLAFEHWNDVLTCDTGSILGNTSNAPPPFASGSRSSQDNVYNTFPSPVKADGFGFTHASIPSPDIFSIGVTRASDAYGLQGVDSMESRFEAESESLMGRDAFKDSRDLEKFSNPSIYDECGNQALFGEDSLQQYMNSNISLLSHSLGADSADLGTAVTGFLAMSAARTAAVHGKAYRGWRTLLSVLRWRFSIKRIVALKKKTIQGRGKFG
ncbi:calmodulin-binding protein 60 D-like isoform X2 [Phoenix dactylifera]|nr:calmodulin-binding protein 60 D-like isoform X2 [Phoenix dactylifera]